MNLNTNLTDPNILVTTERWEKEELSPRRVFIDSYFGQEDFLEGCYEILNKYSYYPVTKDEKLLFVGFENIPEVFHDEKEVTDKLWIFFDAIDSFKGNLTALGLFMHNYHYNPKEDDMKDIIKHFEESFLGRAEDNFEHTATEWYGKWLVNNEYIKVDDSLSCHIDYRSLGKNAKYAGEMWHDSGYIFQSLR